MRIYTRTGDKGKTGLVGGMLVDKDDVRIECNGMLDEAISVIGLLRIKLAPGHGWQDGLQKIQTDVMNMMSHVATHSSIREANKIDRPQGGDKYCEQWIDDMLAEIEGPDNFFILPGGNEVSALCHVIRAKLRTAERRLITLHRQDPVEEFILKYINRLSDLFFVMARYELYKSGFNEEKLRPFIMRPK